MRRAVRAALLSTGRALSRNTRPVRSAATKTPVPAAESQLMVNWAASGLAPAATTGGMRWTSPWRPACPRPAATGAAEASAEERRI